MSNQRLNGWNPQKTVFTYAKDRKFETGLRKAALYADLGLAEATGGQFHGELTVSYTHLTLPTNREV